MRKKLTRKDGVDAATTYLIKKWPLEKRLRLIKDSDFGIPVMPIIQWKR